MIAVTGLHGKVMFINADLVEFVEANPDTQIVLINGHRYYAQETPEEVSRRIIEYKRTCSSDKSAAWKECRADPHMPTEDEGR